MEYTDDPFFEAGVDFPVLSGDSGRSWRSKSDWGRRIPASAEELKSRSSELMLRQELFELESSLSEHQIEIYERYKTKLTSRSEKIYYLKLLPHERHYYLESKGILTSGHTNDSFSEKKQKESLDYGMSKQDVQRLLGVPLKVEIAGNPRLENERWAYNYEGQARFVYFESGKVDNWE